MHDTLTTDVFEQQPPDSYWTRREHIAALANGATRDPADIEYTEAEHATWQAVASALRPVWDTYACAEVLEARERLALPTNRVPQLREVTERLEPISGFRFRAVPGLVPATDFFRALSESTFLSTQYVRWEGSPLYTPEPDVIHEVIGHADLLACPTLAEMHRLAGAAIARLDDERSRKFVADVFWFSVEFGVVREADAWKAYGAGLLSSHGELRWYSKHAEVRPIDVAEMGTLPYDIDHYQPVLFGARSLDEVCDVIGGFFADASDDGIGAVLRSRGVSAPS